MIYKLKSIFLKGHERSVKANINIFYSLIIKGMSIVSQLALVPLTLDYLDKTQYGIWLTLASIIGWFSFFDIGVGNGLRNKLAEALAKNDLTMARKYVSTSYALVSMIFSAVLALFLFINNFLDWTSILNTPKAMGVELTKLTFFVFSFFCIRFVLTLIGNILFAYQKPALNNLIAPLGNILSLLIIYILTITTEGSLFYVGLTFSAIPVIVLLAFNIILFSKSFAAIRPSIKEIDFSHSGSLLGLGMQFFVIQISALVLFTTSNIIITREFGPDEVTVYNISFKYFSILTMVYGIIVTPFWSAITDAFVKKEYDWIRKTIRKLELIGFGFVLLGVIMLLVSNWVYDLWVGDSVNVPLNMDLIMWLFVVVMILNRPYNVFINGTGKVRLQLYTAVVSIIITIPLALFFARSLGMGPSGVVLSTVCTTFPTMILWRIQYKKILSGKPQGIWNQ